MPKICRKCGHEWIYHTESKVMPNTVACMKCNTDEILEECLPLVVLNQAM